MTGTTPGQVPQATVDMLNDGAAAMSAFIVNCSTERWRRALTTTPKMIICLQSMEPKVRSMLESIDMVADVTVTVSTLVPADAIYVVDPPKADTTVFSLNDIEDE
ncbi:MULTISPECIES: hypothetical protein [unclassified Rhodococcus (in: high G+C Gram-positive bacteria)]|uniref:hypothetical protein n=1 Tax=unclassified Rhodococcus (in: high G+C Gram-positive bacteria) TaxID=192944 RepID=UPI0011401A7C|nr:MULTISPECIES: hypothetical protein [unclassified Rhodococcus (in: high G+C Gram-positive bacteria)]